MPGGYLYGFYTAPGGDPVPVKVACDADGNLLINVENFDLKAQTACKLNGTLYWSCAGVNFSAYNPDTQAITKSGEGFVQVDVNGVYMSAPVFLPNGATVTKVIVYGNAASEAETYYLRRVRLVDKVFNTLGAALINTEDTSIDYAVIDNAVYGYFLTTLTMDINDQIYGARITYTL